MTGHLIMIRVMVQIEIVPLPGVTISLRMRSLI